MEQLKNADLIIQIDDEIAGLIEEINAGPNGESQVDFAESLKNVVIDSILGPFGLSASVFADRDGGNITTVHNFEHGVVANDSDARRHQEWVEANSSGFDRKGTEATRNYDAQLKAERKPLFQNSPIIESAYTGKELPKDGRAHRDHVISASEIERSAKGQLGQNREDRVRTANSHDNLVWAENGLNSSKSDHDALQWAEKTKVRDGVEMTNAEYFDVDKELLKKTYERARDSVDSAQNLAVLKKQAMEFCTQGGKEAGKLAMRQVIGLILKELATGVIEDIRHIIREGFQSLEHLARVLRARMEAMAEAIKQKWADFLAEGAAAGFAGFLSSLVTVLINSFVTTAKRVVTIIREGVLAVVKSIKLIISPPQGMTGSQIAVEVLKLLAGGVVTAATLTLQEAVAKAMESVPLFAPFAQEISMALVGILGGATGLLTVLAFDRLKSYFAFQNKQLADVHRGQAVALLKVKQTLVMLDSAYGHIRDSTGYMQLQLAEGWAVIEESSRTADAAISGYSSAIENLRKLTGSK
jgi:hypothetical protein